jgi:undecaprenyl-diphosphatase
MMEPWKLLANLDAAVALWVALHRTRAMTAILRLFTYIGGPSGMVILGAIVCGLLWWRRGRRPALTVAGALISTSVLNELLKALFHRARPPGDWLTLTSGLSFPSGHAMTSMAFFLVLAVVLSSVGPARRARPLMVTAGILLSLVIGWSRVYLGVHYISDVLAGYLFGAVWGLIWLRLVRRTAIG